MNRILMVVGSVLVPAPIPFCNNMGLNSILCMSILRILSCYTCRLGDKCNMFRSAHTRSSQNDPFSSSDSSGCITSHIVMNSIVFMFFTLNKHRHVFSPLNIHSFCICILLQGIVPGLHKRQFGSSYDRNTSHSILSFLSHHRSLS